MNNKRRDLACLAAAGVALYAGQRIVRTALGYSFAGKTVLVTGSSRGLGFVLARRLLRSGARVVITARDEVELRKASELLPAADGQLFAIAADLSSPVDVEGLVGMIQRTLGPIDVLINNAGVIQVGPLETMTPDDFREAMDINFWGAVNTTMAVLPQMLARQSGRIVNVTSIGGRISVPHLVPYSASKFALVGFSDGLRAELAKDGIVVTTVCPGLMRTGSPRNALFKGRHREEYAWFSISDSLPLISISAERAAAQILNACRRGDPHVILSLAARLAVIAQGVAPGLTSRLLSRVNQVLPSAGGVGSQTRRGYESESGWSPSWLTALTERAARRNNELAHGSNGRNQH